MSALVTGHKGYIGTIRVPMSQAWGFTNSEEYSSFAQKAKETKRNLLDFLIHASRTEIRTAI